MNSKDAIKRLRQETCPCTYMPDFDKEECLKVIERDLEVLNIFKKYLSLKVCKKLNNDETYYILLEYNDKDTYDYIGIFINEEEKDLLKEWYNE